MFLLLLALMVCTNVGKLDRMEKNKNLYSLLTQFRQSLWQKRELLILSPCYLIINFLNSLSVFVFFRNVKIKYFLTCEIYWINLLNEMKCCESYYRITQTGCHSFQKKCTWKRGVCLSSVICSSCPVQLILILLNRRFQNLLSIGFSDFILLYFVFQNGFSTISWSWWGIYFLVYNLLLNIPVDRSKKEQANKKKESFRPENTILWIAWFGLLCWKNTIEIPASGWFCMQSRLVTFDSLFNWTS